MSLDVVVVGGGPGGLAAGALLARSGARVRVLEGAAKVGGRASTEDVEGFRFDRGAHALFLGGPAERVLRGLGAFPAGRKAFTTDSVVVHRGQAHPLPDGLGALASSSWLGPGGRWALAGWFARVGLGLAPPAGTVADWLAELPPDVRDVAAAFVRVATYSGDLHRMDAAYAAAVLSRSVRSGVFYVEGGWQRLVDGLRAAAERAGAEVSTGVAVRSVRPGAVVTDAGEVAARHVVVALPPEAARAVCPGLPEGPAGSRVAALQLALRGGPPLRLALSTDRPVFVSNFSPVVPMGPPGVQVVHAIRYLPDDAPVDDATARADVDATLDTVWPGWRGAVVAQRWLPRMVTSPSVPAPGAPRLGVDAAPGVWLVGDGWGPEGHLLDAALASAAAVAGRVGASAEAAA